MLGGRLKDADVSWVTPDDLETVELEESVLGVAVELWELLMRESEEMGPVKERASIPGATSMLQGRVATGRPSTVRRGVDKRNVLALFSEMGCTDVVRAEETEDANDRQMFQNGVSEGMREKGKEWCSTDQFLFSG